MVAFQLVQVLRGAIDELPAKNEASANRNAVFYESAVVNEGTVCEGDELSHSVGGGVAECVVHFDVFDNAPGAGRKAYGTQKEEQKCFHNEIMRLKVKLAKGSRPNARHKGRGRDRWMRSGKEIARCSVFFWWASAKVKQKFGINKCFVLLFVAMIGFSFDV